MNVWFWKSKGQTRSQLRAKLGAAMKHERYKRFPSDIRDLGESYRALIRELAKR